MKSVRKFLAIFIAPFLPALANRAYNESFGKYYKDNGEAHTWRISYNDFLVSYRKELKTWVQTGKWE